MFDAIAAPRGGVVPTPFHILLESPELALLTQALGAFCRYRTTLGPRLSELLVLITATHWGAEYEFAVHAPEARKAGVVFSSQSIGSMFGVYFRDAPPRSFAEVMQCDRERFNRFFHAMLDNGIYLAPSAYETGFVSAAHDRPEIDTTLAAARNCFQRLS